MRDKHILEDITDYAEDVFILVLKRYVWNLPAIIFSYKKKTGRKRLVCEKFCYNDFQCSHSEGFEAS